MNKTLKLILIITALLLLIFAGVMFFKGMTGRVVLDTNKNDSDSETNTISSENETNRDINTFDVVNKTDPGELEEKECLVREDGRKFCLVKRGAKVNAGAVTDENGNS